MICPNCKAMLASNATRCHKCGQVFNNQGNQPFVSNQYNNSYNQQNSVGSGPLYGQSFNNQQNLGSTTYNNYAQGPQNFNNQSYSTPPQQVKQKNPSSGLGIAALIFSIFGCTLIVGIILAIIDLCKKDGKSKTLSQIALGICGAWLFFGVLGIFNKNDRNTNDVSEITTETVTEAISEEMKDEDSPSEKASGPIKIGIGDVFENKTISGTVIYADLDYKDYDSTWVEVPEGKKVIFIKIKVTNISDKSNYVSVGDFDCYVDNISTSAEIFSGEDDDYNDNIEPGRSAILGAMYVVSDDAKCIELEYRPLGEYSERTVVVISDESTTETILEAEEGAGDSREGVSDDIDRIGIGDEFGNNTITGVVEDANLDYKGYDSTFTEVPEGKKAIYIKIKVTNISEESNYVSVGDFDCYVDDIIVKPEMFSGEDDYNANIEADRSAILGGMYIIPEDAESIELEYTPIGESSKRVIIKIQ